MKLSHTSRPDDIRARISSGYYDLAHVRLKTAESILSRHPEMLEPKPSSPHRKR